MAQTIFGIGTDIVQIRRISTVVKRYNEAFLKRIFTPKEREIAASFSETKKMAYLAKRYAAKEAFSKAVGSGMGAHVHWNEIEILNDDRGAPVITLLAQTAANFQALIGKKKADIRVSLSDDVFACAFVIITLND
ncbi:MAG: holo-ACP synthase [Lactobacillales bacterium]|jgi:holo-[acyl-carrier protein] synthase|nr:holo-ACP synthase [Lactobacillales bacterium]